jgi:hypothetical protein
MARNNFQFLEYSVQLTLAGRVFPETHLARAVAVGTVYNETYELLPLSVLSEAELAPLSPRTTVKGTRRSLSVITKPNSMDIIL